MRKLKNEELIRLDTEAFKKAKKTPITIVTINSHPAIPAKEGVMAYFFFFIFLIIL